MPYKTDGSDVPEGVAGLSATKRRQWAAIWNSVYRKCKADGGGDECEGTAFAQANGVVVKQQEVSMPDENEVVKTEVEVEPEIVEQEPDKAAEVEAKPVNPTAPVPSAAAAAVTEEDVPANPTSPADAPNTDGGGAVSAVEMDGLSALRDHLQAALELLADMTPSEEPVPAEEPMEAAEVFTESAVLELVEQDAGKNRRAALDLDVGIIKVGPGNARDNHYYTDDLLERDGGVFKGAKMYATDHRNDERSVRTEVSVIEDVLGVREFADGRYLVGRAIVFNPDFAEDVRNRADRGILNTLHCSILAKGSAKPGKVGEVEYNIVQEITDAQSVDWVTRAGAGGHALQLSESEAEAEPEAEAEQLDETEARPVTLSEATEEVIQPLPLAKVIAELGKTNLPAASVAQLASGPYANLSEVNTAVSTEVARLKTMGSGKPLGTAKAALPTVKSLQEIQAGLQAVNQKWLGGR